MKRPRSDGNRADTRPVGSGAGATSDQSATGPQRTGGAVFRFQGVSVSFGDKQVLRDLDLSVPGAGITVVIGPSGSGKSTLVRLCNRLLDPTSGTVRFRDAPLSELDVLELRHRVGMVFQRPVLFPGSTRDNLTITGVDDPERIKETLIAVGLDPEVVLPQEAKTLSGGEAQRLCLARTLLTRPEVLVADEPTSALDHSSVRMLEELVRQISASGTPVLWVTHDTRQLHRLADLAVVLVAGRVIAVGTPGELDASDDPAVAAILRSGDEGA